MTATPQKQRVKTSLAGISHLDPPTGEPSINTEIRGVIPTSSSAGDWGPLGLESDDIIGQGVRPTV